MQSQCVGDADGYLILLKHTPYQWQDSILQTKATAFEQLLGQLNLELALD